MYHNKIINDTRYFIYNLYLAHNLSLQRGKCSNAIIQYFNFSISEKNSSSQVIRWKRLSINWIKLNVDGASKGNPGDSGSAGIFQNSNCEFLLAIAIYFGHHTSVFAEAKAVHIGVQQAFHISFSSVWIELGSLIHVNILSGLSPVPWSIVYIIQDIRNSLSSF